MKLGVSLICASICLLTLACRPAITNEVLLAVTEIQEANADSNTYEFLGIVEGISSRGAPVGIPNARVEAKIKAYDSGATHIAYVSESVGWECHVSAKIYRKKGTLPRPIAPKSPEKTNE